MEDSEPIDFEKSLDELEKLVTQMEKGEFTLEQSLAAYEKGVRLTNQCRKALDDAQKRIDEISSPEEG